MKNVVSAVGKVAAGALVGVGLVIIGVSLINVLQGRDVGISLIGGVTLGSVCLGAGVWIWRASGRAGEAARDIQLKRHEKMVLETARRNGGHLTATELSMKSKLSLQESEAVLQNLQLRGHAEINVTEAGALIYHFRELGSSNKGLL